MNINILFYQVQTILTQQFLTYKQFGKKNIVIVQSENFDRPVALKYKQGDMLLDIRIRRMLFLCCGIDFSLFIILTTYSV